MESLYDALLFPYSLLTPGPSPLVKTLTVITAIIGIIPIVIITVVERKRHECSRGKGRLCAMAFTASPVEHLLIVIRERITDQLASEGHSEDIRVQADQLALGLWSGQTADVVLSEVREVLPRQEFLGILAFCSDKYPLLYASLPADINGNNAQPVQWSFIQSGQNVQQISWPQHVPKAE